MACICWAVLDTGIHADHPHFDAHKNVREQWDCTKRGAPTQHLPGADGFANLDGNGHGTHVAGIISGERTATDKDGRKHAFAGMAPRCSLIGLKVLDNRGNGNDSWIIKALDLVAAMNEKAGKLVVHGLNLSLGGGFDPSAFGCGHTPLCQEIRRLWQQGVLVCLAAGNEGYAVLNSAEGEIPTNMDLSIGDPANLEEAIAVGSVHKTNPHTYGISYFSSRGPTADGRRKPDVVAPGEKILSARHDWKQPASSGSEMDDLYVSMSGTSMATPHVSGMLAAFLSLRREFIGYPDRVKALLMEGCIDLRRDQYMQGAGLPNLIKMLAFN
jgi:subtilisin family serine protease